MKGSWNVDSLNRMNADRLVLGRKNKENEVVKGHTSWFGHVVAFFKGRRNMASENQAVWAKLRTVVESRHGDLGATIAGRIFERMNVDTQTPLSSRKAESVLDAARKRKYLGQLFGQDAAHLAVSQILKSSPQILLSEATPEQDRAIMQLGQTYKDLTDYGWSTEDIQLVQAMKLDLDSVVADARNGADVSMVISRRCGDEVENMAQSILSQQISGVDRIKAYVLAGEAHAVTPALVKENKDALGDGPDIRHVALRLFQDPDKKQILEQAGVTLSDLKSGQVDQGTLDRLLNPDKMNAAILKLLSPERVVADAKKVYIEQHMKDTPVRLSDLEFSDTELEDTTLREALEKFGSMNLLDPVVVNMMESEIKDGCKFVNQLSDKIYDQKEALKKGLSDEFDSNGAKHITLDNLSSGLIEALKKAGLDSMEGAISTINLADKTKQADIQGLVSLATRAKMDRARPLFETADREIRSELGRETLGLEDIYRQAGGFTAVQTRQLIQAGVGPHTAQQIMTDETTRDISFLLMEGKTDDALGLIRQQLTDAKPASDPQLLEQAARTIYEQLVPEFAGSKNTIVMKGDTYQLMRNLGKGQFGNVLEFMNTRTGKAMAVKMISKQTDDDQQVGRVLNESRLQSRSIGPNPHTNIMGLHGMIKSEQGYAGVLMECAANGELKKGLAHFQDAELKRDLMGQLADGLLHMHNQGVVHLDLKPENIILGKTGDRLVPKLIDFGLSRRFNALTDQETESDAVGTPGYAAPESVKSLNSAKNAGIPLFSDLSAKSDVFSLGVIFFQLATIERTGEGETETITSRMPFKCDGMSAHTHYLNALRTHLQGCTGDHNEIPPQLCPEGSLYKDLINQMLHPEPEKRPPMDVVKKVIEGNAGALAAFIRTLAA